MEVGKTYEVIEDGVLHLFKAGDIVKIVKINHVEEGWILCHRESDDEFQVLVETELEEVEVL